MQRTEQKHTLFNQTQHEQHCDFRISLICLCLSKYYVDVLQIICSKQISFFLEEPRFLPVPFTEKTVT